MKRYRKVSLTGMNITDSRTGRAAVAFWREGHLYVVPRNKLKQVI